MYVEVYNQWRSMQGLRKIVCMIGSGMGEEMGLPRYGESSPYDGLPDVTMFKETPGEVWKWVKQQRQLAERAVHHPAYIALKAMEKNFPYFYCLSQTIDGAAERAGQKRLIELYGNIYREKAILSHEEHNHYHLDNPVSASGQLLRPDIIMTGEEMSPRRYLKACGLAGIADIFIIAGTHLNLSPGNELPQIAKDNGAYVIEIQPKKRFAHTDLHISASVAMGLPLLSKLLIDFSKSPPQQKI